MPDRRSSGSVSGHSGGSGATIRAACPIRISHDANRAGHAVVTLDRCVTFWVPARDAARLKAWAAQEQTTVSALIRRILVRPHDRPKPPK